MAELIDLLRKYPTFNNKPADTEVAEEPKKPAAEKSQSRSMTRNTNRLKASKDTSENAE